MFILRDEIRYRAENAAREAARLIAGGSGDWTVVQAIEDEMWSLLRDVADADEPLERLLA